MSAKPQAIELASPLAGNLLDERLLSYRHSNTGERVAATLPELFVALAADAVRDFPALRPHQRHPWHAFLVQLAAIALHRASSTAPFDHAHDWRSALLALTPGDPDGAPWCLVGPVDRPAFMQAADPGASISEWKNVVTAPDELDMLVTSRNHDLKPSRMQSGSPEDWIFALISLQTQEGFLGAGNYGVSRMNGGFASRCGVGVHPMGRWGRRWMRDLAVLQAGRKEMSAKFNFTAANPVALVWTVPWNGSTSLDFASLDPWYIEICRRVRLTGVGGIKAHVVGSKAARIAAKELNGVTGDPWMPIDTAAAKALTLTELGFDYKLSVKLLLGEKYTKPPAQMLMKLDDSEGLFLLARGVTRGQGKTEGYHERRIPISKKMRQAFLLHDTDELARLAQARIVAIAETRKMLWSALVVLFGNAAQDEAGKDKGASDVVKDRANTFARPFETECDAQFFPELIEEIEAEPQDREALQSQWLQVLADRAEQVLRAAFVAGPRSSQLRYRAQSAALARLHNAMRSDKSKLPALATALKNPSTSPAEEAHEPT